MPAACYKFLPMVVTSRTFVPAGRGVTVLMVLSMGLLGTFLIRFRRVGDGFCRI